MKPIVIKQGSVMKQLKEGDKFQQAWKGCTNPMWFKVLSVDRPNNSLRVECHGINGYTHEEELITWYKLVHVGRSLKITKDDADLAYIEDMFKEISNELNIKFEGA